MNKKLLGILIVLLFSASCLTIVCAENNTNETLEAVDNTNYIMPITISDDSIEFSDGFTGFRLDLAKDSLIAEDGFTAGETSSDKTENYVKLAIIECYKQGKENDVGKIVAKIINNDMNDDNPIIDEVLNSDEMIGDHEVVMIDNTTEATFDFELLKSVSDEKSDCLAYKVSLESVPESEDVLGASDNGNDTSDNETAASSDDSDAGRAVQSDNGTDDKVAKSSDDTNANKTQAAGNDVKSSDDSDAKKAPASDKDDAKAKNKTGEKKAKSDDAPKNNTETKQTNKTIINKTTTTIVNENNTTIINKNNVKTINETTNDTPQDDNVQNLLKKSGNPIFILIVVIAIIIVAAVVLNRKD